MYDQKFSAWGIVFIATALTACGADSGKSSGSSTVSASGTPQGNWARACQTTTSNGTPSGSSKLKMQIGTAIGTITAPGYTTTDCSGSPVLETIVEFAYTVGADVVSPAGAKEFNVVPGKVTMAPKSDSTTTTWNIASYCGFSNWQTNVHKDVSACSPGNTAAQFTLFKVQGSSLLTGKESAGHDGKTAATRHVLLDTTSPMTRQ